MKNSPSPAVEDAGCKGAKLKTPSMASVLLFALISLACASPALADSIAVTDLHPSGATSSYAFAIHGSQQVGYVALGGTRHAALWSNTPESFVDLHPSGAATSSVAEATSGLYQAGNTVVPTNKSHAAMWSGTASSFIDLHPASLPISGAHAVTDSQQLGVVNGG